MQTCPTCGSTQKREDARFCSKCGSALTGSAPGATGLLAPNTILQDRYVIVNKVGKGGMGAVYQAQDLHLPGKFWAVKELSPALLADPTEHQQAMASFRHEFELLAALDHVNLPKVTDLFEQDGKQYFVMDFVDGQTLGEVVAQTPGFLGEATVLAWADQLCEVLEYLHTRQPPIIFRDLKPANIMLTRDGRLKLIDFGIARFFEPGKTKDTAPYGTVGYSAPEQFGTVQTDPRCDVYSLGVTLHHLLTKYDPGLTPFNLPAPRTINPQVSPDTEAVIVRATKSAAVERFQSVAEMRRALHPEPFQGNQNAQPLVACVKCGRADDTLRATAFLYVISIVIMTFKRGWGGVLCQGCRVKYGLLFTLVSLAFGPWGFPWGIIYTLEAFFSNLSGGKQPKEENAALLAYQGARFYERSDYVSANSCLSASLALQNDAGVAALLDRVRPLAARQVPSVRVQPLGTQLPYPAGPSSAWKGVFALGAIGVIGFLGFSALVSPNTTEPNQRVAGVVSASATPWATIIMPPPTPPPTETAVASGQPDAVVQQRSVDLRTGPGYWYDTNTTLDGGQALHVFGYAPNDSDWFEVYTDDGKQGWVNIKQIRLYVPLSKLSAVPVPATPTPKPTAAASPAATATSVWLLADDFKDNENIWTMATGKSYFAGGAYHVTQTDAGYSYWPSCVRCGPFSDFAYEAMIRKVEGPDDRGYGLSFRITNGAKRTFYVFEIDGDGLWEVSKTTPNGWQQVQKWTYDSAINTGNSKNKLRVICRGSTLEFYANDRFLGSVTDDSFSSGNVGVGVGTAGLHIQVEYVRVWPAQ